MMDELLEPYGLVLIGSLKVKPEYRVPDIAENQAASQLLLIGNAGSSLWQAFSHSTEFADGLVDPLDRWSKRVGKHLAGKLGGRAIFPFEGPPYPPFLSWSNKTGQVFNSRISMSIHGQLGLWHAYRFALALPKPLTGLGIEAGPESPCLSCAEQACLKACPVDAFTYDDYLVDQCVDYLASDSGSDCRKLGCEARRACPVGTQFTYLPRHAKFHMDAFLVGMGHTTSRID